MIDVRELKIRRDEIAKNIAQRNMNVDIDAVIALSDDRSSLMQQAETLRAKRNENAQKMKGKLDPETRTNLIADGKALKEQIAQLESKLSGIEEEFQRLARTIPNYAHPMAPVGKEDKD